MQAKGTQRPAMSDRDCAVVELVGQFKQLTAGHIAAALFADRSSQTPCDRALKRLCDRGFLMRLERPIGGSAGGSAQYVYQVGRAGWRLLRRDGSYWAARAINPHTLMIADCFIQLHRAERRGDLALLRFDAEPISHRNVGPIQLTPDAYVEVGIPARRLRFNLMLEIDLGTEHARVIQEKCVRYWRAYERWRGKHFPYVVFIVPDAARHREITRIVMGGPEQAREIFRISWFPDFTKTIRNEWQ